MTLTITIRLNNTLSTSPTNTAWVLARAVERIAEQPQEKWPMILCDPDGKPVGELKVKR